MSAPGHRLSAVTKELMAKWHETREYWQDEKAREFEKTYIQELLAGVDATTPVIQQIDKLISKIKKDCE
jgi:hypothetical protein